MKTICLAALALGALALAKDSAPPPPVKAEAELLLDEGYCPRVLDLLRSARTEIVAVLYLIGDPDQDRPGALLKALTDAKGRGVHVRVLLDKDKKDRSKNREAFAFLKDAGVDVSWDDPDDTLHTKVVVVDGEFLVVGSTNWTQGAMKHNREAGALLRSKELAKRLLAAYPPCTNP